MERAPVRSQLEEMLWPSRWWSDGTGARGAGARAADVVCTRSTKLLETARQRRRYNSADAFPEANMDPVTASLTANA